MTKEKIERFETDNDLKEFVAELHETLPNLFTVGEYSDVDTPFELFDSEFHAREIKDEETGKKVPIKYTDSHLIFLIKTAEFCKRPIDMLMYLGEYFKGMIQEHNYVSKMMLDSTKIRPV